MKNNKGFTLIELIGIIIVFSIISVLAFTSFTKMLKDKKTDEIEDYKQKLITATTLYVEMHLSDFPALDQAGGTVTISAKQLSDEGYLNSNMDSPDECSLNNATIKAVKESDNTITYIVNCAE